MKQKPQPTHSNFWAFVYIWGIILLILAGAAFLTWRAFLQ